LLTSCVHPLEVIAHGDVGGHEYGTISIQCGGKVITDVFASTAEDD
jgi:hypothetical protein